jgi:hypothetical protein
MNETIREILASHGKLDVAIDEVADGDDLGSRVA